MKAISSGNMKSGQSGVVILEALIAILLFSIGILGLVGTLATSVSNASEAQYRTEAAFHAESLIAELRVASPLTRASDYASYLGPSYVTWKNRVATGANALPGAGLTANRPTTAFSGTNNQNVTITIRWQTNNGTQRTYAVVTSLE